MRGDHHHPPLREQRAIHIASLNGKRPSLLPRSRGKRSAEGRVRGDRLHRWLRPKAPPRPNENWRCVRQHTSHWSPSGLWMSPGEPWRRLTTTGGCGERSQRAVRDPEGVRGGRRRECPARRGQETTAQSGGDCQRSSNELVHTSTARLSPRQDELPRSTQ